MSTPGKAFTIALQLNTGQIIKTAMSLDVTQRQSGTLDWSLTLADDDRMYEPDASSTTWAGLLNDLVWSSDGTQIVKWLEVSGTIDGVSWSLPRMIPDHYGYQLQRGNFDTIYTWGGVGPALPLYKEDQTLRTLNSSSSGAWSVSSALQDLSLIHI